MISTVQLISILFFILLLGCPDTNVHSSGKCIDSEPQIKQEQRELETLRAKYLQVKSVNTIAEYNKFVNYTGESPYYREIKNLIVKIYEKADPFKTIDDYGKFIKEQGYADMQQLSAEELSKSFNDIKRRLSQFHSFPDGTMRSQQDIMYDGLEYDFVIPEETKKSFFSATDAGDIFFILSTIGKVKANQIFISQVSDSLLYHLNMLSRQKKLIYQKQSRGFPRSSTIKFISKIKAFVFGVQYTVYGVLDSLDFKARLHSCENRLLANLGAKIKIVNKVEHRDNISNGVPFDLSRKIVLMITDSESVIQKMSRLGEKQVSVLIKAKAGVHYYDIDHDSIHDIAWVLGGEGESFQALFINIDGKWHLRGLGESYTNVDCY